MNYKKGYKVINENAFINEKENTVTDTIFFFPTLEMANEYLESVQNSFFKHNGADKYNLEHKHTLEPMTKDEKEKFGFEVPLNYRIPYKTIYRPLIPPQNEPYWVETRELVMPK